MKKEVNQEKMSNHLETKDLLRQIDLELLLMRSLMMNMMMTSMMQRLVKTVLIGES